MELATPDSRPNRWANSKGEGSGACLGRDDLTRFEGEGGTEVPEPDAAES